jgi:hypothetical protein
MVCIVAGDAEEAEGLGARDAEEMRDNGRRRCKGAEGAHDLVRESAVEHTVGGKPEGRVGTRLVERFPQLDVGLHEVQVGVDVVFISKVLVLPVLEVAEECVMAISPIAEEDCVGAEIENEGLVKRIIEDHVANNPRVGILVSAAEDHV